MPLPSISSHRSADGQAIWNGEAVAVRRLTKRFPHARLFSAPANTPVLSDVSFSLGFGEIFGILGPNGAGKTTLLETVATLIEPTSGTVTVCGYDVVQHTAGARAGIGYSGAAGHAFYGRMTGQQNLEFFATLNDLPRAEARRRATAWLDAVGLAGASTRRVEIYSEGMRQRLSLARALVADPPVLLLDEPTRSVDSAFRHVVHGLLRRRVEASAPRAVVLVTHSLAEAEVLCDRVCLLDRGTLVWVGSARAVRGRATAQAQTRPETVAARA